MSIFIFLKHIDNKQFELTKGILLKNQRDFDNLKFDDLKGSFERNLKKLGKEKKISISKEDLISEESEEKPISKEMVISEESETDMEEIEEDIDEDDDFFEGIEM